MIRLTCLVSAACSIAVLPAQGQVWWTIGPQQGQTTYYFAPAATMPVPTTPPRPVPSEVIERFYFASQPQPGWQIPDYTAPSPEVPVIIREYFAPQTPPAAEDPDLMGELEAGATKPVPTDNLPLPPLPPMPNVDTGNSAPPASSTDNAKPLEEEPATDGTAEPKKLPTPEASDADSGADAETPLEDPSSTDERATKPIPTDELLPPGPPEG